MYPVGLSRIFFNVRSITRGLPHPACFIKAFPMQFCCSVHYPEPKAILTQAQVQPEENALNFHVVQPP